MCSFPRELPFICFIVTCSVWGVHALCDHWMAGVLCHAVMTFYSVPCRQASLCASGTIQNRESQNIHEHPSIWSMGKLKCRTPLVGTHIRRQWIAYHPRIPRRKDAAALEAKRQRVARQIERRRQAGEGELKVLVSLGAQTDE